MAETWKDRLRNWAREMKRDVIAIGLAARDPRVSWPVRVAALLVAAYALSPVDLIPDFIPVVGYLDELILLPAALWLILRSVDPQVLAELRTRASAIADRPRSTLGLAIVVTVWIAFGAALAWLLWPWVRQWRAPGAVAGGIALG